MEYRNCINKTFNMFVSLIYEMGLLRFLFSRRMESFVKNGVVYNAKKN